MKKITILFITSMCLVTAIIAQITPTVSPYSPNGPYGVISDSANVPNSKKVVMYRPNVPPVGQKYPTLIFQPGANGFGSSAINVHSYDLYMKHLVTYGYVVIVIDATAAGLPNGADFKKVYAWYKTMTADQNHWLNTYSNATKVFIGGHSNGGVNASALVADNGSPTEIAGIVYFASYPSNNFLVSQNVSTYGGYVLDLAGSADATTALADAKTGYNKFNAAQCRTFVNITGADHGAFGDYVNSGQPVGPIGRVNATATVRHYLVSYLEAYAKNNQTANNTINLIANRPTTTTEFLNPCAITTDLVENKNELTVFIYPNPSKDFAFVKLTGIDQIKSLSVFNILGEKIDVEISLDANNQETYSINTRMLNSGLYSLIISSNNAHYFTKSFVVSN